MTAAHLSPGGHGVFVVHPPPGSHGCTITVAGSSDPIECDNQYVVACDATLPESEPFCRVVSETSVSRESIYPENKRR